MSVSPTTFSWLNTPAWLPLVYALLHTFWQGALAAGGLALALRTVPARHANLRYGLSAAAMGLVVLAGVGSWALLDAPRRSATGAVRSPDTSAVGTHRRAETFSPFVAVLRPVPLGAGFATRSANPSLIVDRSDVGKAKWWVPWVAAGWLLGVAVFLLRAAKGTLAAGRLRKRCRGLTEPRVLELVEHLRVRLGVWRRVQLLVCDEIGVPSMLGVFYPALLLPASLLTGVPPEQLRAILAHELAHVRRWDYLANLMQMLVEAWLFFNPFVWWISRQMRLEREACCDQVAAGECPSSTCYVEALVAVIERGRLANHAAPPILAANGPDAHASSTLERVRRLLVPGYQPALRVRWFSLAGVLVLSVLALSGWWLGARAVAQSIQSAEATTPKAGEGSKSPATMPGLPADALAAARAGNANQATRLLEASLKPKRFGEEDAARVLDELIRARELRAFTTLHDSWRFYARDWKLRDELLAALIKDQRTDFLDALLARRFDLNRLTKAAEAADAATAGWITRRVTEVAKQQADVGAICQAAADNDLPALQRLLDQGVDVNGVGQDDNTPLIRAVFKNQMEAAQWLLDHGAQVDKPRLPGSNYTPLCLVNSVPMAELLKKHGADAHAELYGRDVSIFTYVVMWAPADVAVWFLKQGADAKAMGDHHENLLFGLKDGATAEALLETGADPNVLSEFGQTPLTSAQSAAVARALIRHGADLKPTLKDSVTLLEQTIYRTRRQDSTSEEDAALIEELIKQGAEFDPKGNGARAMVRAAFYDRVGEVRVFLDHGVSPDAVDDHDHSERRSALASAAYQGPHVLKLLLERGANPNAPLEDGQISPLSAALASRNFECADLLRQAGATGVSDLAYYSAKGDEAKVDALLAQHVDPNEADSSGWTPLRYAVQHGEATMAKQLLDHGANVDQFDNWGFTPYVSFRLYKNMIEGDASQARMQWKLSSQEATARLAAFQQLFAQYPPNPAYRNVAGRTALHQAVWTGSFIVGTMLDKRVPHFDPNLPDKEGRFPLLLAALSPVAKATRETVTTGANTPQQKTWSGQAHVAHELLEAGARLDLAGPGGKTVGELALAAARDAHNSQLEAVLTAALAGLGQPVAVSPTPTPAENSQTPSAAATPVESTEKPSASPAPPSAQELAALGQRLRDDLSAAAHLGDTKRLDALMATAWKPLGKFDKLTAAQMLGDALRTQDLTTFVALHDAVKKTNFGNDWKIGAGQLAALVKGGRTDFLDALLARRLDPARLSTLVSTADAHTAEWISRRVAEVSQQRADIEALGHAARDNDLPALRRLLDAGVDVNAVDHEDNTALIEAVFQNRLDAARFLLERGAEVDKVRYPGWDYTPLCLVTSVEMAQLLKDHGANLHATLFKRDTNILTYVAMWQSAEVVAWFLKQGLDPKMIGDNDQNLLFGVGDPKAAKMLMDLGVDANRSNEFGMPPISQARSEAVAQALIDGGAKLTGFKRPLVPEMIQRGGGDAIAAVLKAGEVPDSETLQKLLIQAAHSDSEGAVKVLLKYGAKPNEPGVWSGEMKELPLQVCCILGGAKTTKVLLEAGADPNGGKTPGVLLGIAMHNRHREVAKLLRAAGAKGVSDLAFALAIEDAAQVKTLLASAPAFKDNASFWDDVLPNAARLGDVDTVRAALAHGVPVEAKALDQGEDAYAAAANEGQHEALAVLLATRTPDANPADLRAALWRAVWNCHPYDNQRSVEHFERCVEMLLAAKAPVSGYQEERDLMVAAVFSRNPGGNPKVMEMLIHAGVDPNPVLHEPNKPPIHLVDAVQKACAEGYCSTPVAQTLSQLVRLSAAPNATAPGISTPAPTPTSPPDGSPAAGTSAAKPSSADAARVSMLDGTPLGKEPVTVQISMTQGLGGTSVETQPLRDDTFYLHFNADTTSATVAVEQPGCAPVYVGPFDKENLHKFDHLQVKLTRGYAGAVQVVDEAGQPVANARLRSYYPGPPVVSFADAVSDAAGNAVIDHLADAPVNIRVLADGFQADEVTALRLDPAKPYSWTLKPTRQLPGTVVSAVTGKPVAGAVIKLAGVRGGPHEESSFDPKKAVVLTTTDAQGGFVLGSLRMDSRYYLFVEAPGHGGVYLRGVKLDQKQLSVTLDPELTIQGKIVHVPPSVVHMGKVHLQYGQTFEIGENYSGVAGDNADLVPVNGEASFTVGPFYKVLDASAAEPKGPGLWDGKTVGIYVDTWGRAGFSPNDLPVSNFVFDLAKQSNPRDPALSEPEAASIEKAANATPAPEPLKAGQPNPAVQALSPVKQNTVSLPGSVTDSTTGQPIDGAKIKLAGTENLQVPSMMHVGPSAAATLATTDAQGHFNLDNLRSGIRYWFFVDATGSGGAYLAVPTLPANGLQVKLGPERFIRGRIVHAPASMIHDGKLSLSFSQELLKTPGEEIWTTLVLEPKNGEANFLVGPLYQPQGVYPFNKAPVTLRIDGKAQAYFRAEELPKADYVLNLAPNLGNLDGEYKTDPTSLWTLDLRKDGMAYYFSSGSRYTARHELVGDEVTFTFPDGVQDHLQVDGSELLGSSEPNTLWPIARLKKQ